MFTLNLTSTNSEGVAQFICYYCEDMVGSIHDLKTHFTNEHEEKIQAVADPNSFKVKRVTDSSKMAGLVNLIPIVVVEDCEKKNEEKLN